MKENKIAFIGSGYMAQEHAKAFASHMGVKLSGVFGRTQNSAQLFASDFGMKVAGSIAELYESTKADLVIVAVDELSILEVVLETFRFPWAVLIEKPPGYRPVDAAKLLSNANENNVRCFVALNRRFMSSARLVCEKLTSNSDARFVSVVDQEDLVQAEQLGHPADVCKHWMYANAIHVVDLLRYFARGKVIEVRRLIPWNHTKLAALVVASIHFDSGDTGLYKAVWNAPGPWSAEVITETERFELRPLETVAMQLRGKRILEKLETNVDDLNYKPGLRLQAKHALQMLNGEKHSLPELADAIESMLLVEKIYS